MKTYLITFQISVQQHFKNNNKDMQIIEIAIYISVQHHTKI